MKKITLILAALAVCASMLLTACGASESGTGSNNSGNNANNSADAGNDDKENDSDDKDKENDNSDGEKEDDSSADVEYVPGTIDENGKFTDEMFGIGADFDTDEWMVMGDDFLAPYNGYATTEEELKSRLEKGNMVYEMMVGKESGSNVNLVVQNFGALGLIFTEEEYIDFSLDTVEDELESSGTMTNPHASKSSITFAGASRYALDVEGSSDGFDLYERIIVIKKGKYMGMITITAQDEKERDEFTKLFYAL